MILIISIISAFAFVWFQQFIYQKYWKRNLDVEINYKYTECMAGEENEINEVVKNNKFLPLTMLHVKFDTPKSFIFKNEENSSLTDFFYRDDIFTVWGKQSAKRYLKFTCSRRGCFYMHDTTLTTSDLFMQKTLTTKVSNKTVIRVFPKKVDLAFFDVPFDRITGNYATQKTLIEDPFEFRGIREYQRYDNMKNINWKSSARNNELKVNNYFMTSSQSVKILLNLDLNIYVKDERLLEEIISLSSSLAEKFILTGIPLSLETNTCDIYTGEQIFINSGSGAAHMRSVDTALCRIDTNASTSDFLEILHKNFEIADQQTYYIIISNKRSKELLDYYSSVKELGISSYFIVPELKQYSVTETAPDFIKWDVEY